MVCMNETASSRLPLCASASDKVYHWRSNGSRELKPIIRTATMPLIYPKESLSVYPKHLSPEYKSTVKRSPSKPLIIVPHTLSELTGPALAPDASPEKNKKTTKTNNADT